MQFEIKIKEILELLKSDLKTERILYEENYNLGRSSRVDNNLENINIIEIKIEILEWILEWNTKIKKEKNMEDEVKKEKQICAFCLKSYYHNGGPLSAGLMCCEEEFKAFLDVISGDITTKHVSCEEVRKRNGYGECLGGYVESKLKKYQYNNRN